MNKILDVKDIILLKCVRGGMSVREMANAIGATSSNTAHKRLARLIEEGYVEAPPRVKMSRSWKLTESGEQAVAPYVQH